MPSSRPERASLDNRYSRISVCGTLGTDSNTVCLRQQRFGSHWCRIVTVGYFWYTARSNWVHRVMLRLLLSSSSLPLLCLFYSTTANALPFAFFLVWVSLQSLFSRTQSPLRFTSSRFPRTHSIPSPHWIGSFQLLSYDSGSEYVPEDEKYTSCGKVTLSSRAVRLASFTLRDRG